LQSSGIIKPDLANDVYQTEKGVRIMRRNGIARLCMYAALAATVAVTLGGCSGGLSSADNGPGAPPGTTATATTPATAAGLALQAAAAAAPATTNTADNPAQAFGLVNTAGLPVVAVNAPPVVNFAVIDAGGKPVRGLTLVRPAGKADPACSTSATATTGNVTLAMAKWDTSTYSQGVWQSLISQQTYATTDASKNQYSVAQGAADPKPTATLTNPATVAMTVDTSTGKATVSDQGNQIVGILTENATEGYYTYAFAIDVSTKLLFADAVAKKNTSTGKTANNGNLAVKDGKTIHRLGMQLCYTDPVSKKAVVVNPYVDFTLAAAGTATPVTVSATDKTLKPYRQVVDKASCNDCHKKLTAHGTRVDPNYCVICHNPGSTDPGTNNPIDLKLMIHRFHMGAKNFINTGLDIDYKVASFVARATTVDPVTKVSTFTGVGYPQDIRNCVKCHDGSASATHKTADGNNWMNAPSRNACGSCHGGINFATGGGSTRLDYVAWLKDTTKPIATSGHGGGIQGSDSGCTTCHPAAYVASKHTLPTTSDANQRTMSATITKAAVDATTGKVTVTFTMTKAGTPVTDPTQFVLTGFTLAKLISPTNGSPSHWQSYTSRYTNKNVTKAPVLEGYYEQANATNAAAAGTTPGTLVNVGAGVYTYTFALGHADTPGDIRTITKARDQTSATLVMTPPLTNTRGTLIANPAKGSLGFSLGGVTNTDVDTSYDPNATHRVGLLFTENDTAKTANHDNAWIDFVPSGKTAPTRNIVDMASCQNGCHSGTRLHIAYNTKVCVTCHTETTFDPTSPATALGGGDYPSTVDGKRLWHRLHMGDSLPQVLLGNSLVVNGTDFTDVAFPQSPVSNCLACHLSATNALNSEATNWQTVPSRRACGACHDGIDFSTGNGSTIKDVNAWVAAKKVGTVAASTHAGGAQPDDSRCAKCHDAGSISLYHIK